MGERTAVDIFELASDRHTVRDAARADIAPGGALAEKMRGGLALHRRIRREDHLVHFTGIEQRFEFARTDLFRADAIER